MKYLPPYSPDMNPIELAWSKVKQFLRTAKARTREALETALRWAMDMTTENDARNWFIECGYPVQAT